MIDPQESQPPLENEAPPPEQVPPEAPPPPPERYPFWGYRDVITLTGIAFVLLMFVGTTTIFFAAVNLMKIVPYFMLAQFSAKNLSTSLALLPIAVAANFAGIWLVKTAPTAHFYRITYILLFILGSILLWQGASHFLHTAR